MPLGNRIKERFSVPDRYNESDIRDLTYNRIMHAMNLGQHQATIWLLRAGVHYVTYPLKDNESINSTEDVREADPCVTRTNDSYFKLVGPAEKLCKMLLEGGVEWRLRLNFYHNEIIDSNALSPSAELIAYWSYDLYRAGFLHEEGDAPVQIFTLHQSLDVSGHLALKWMHKTMKTASLEDRRKVWFERMDKANARSITPVHLMILSEGADFNYIIPKIHSALVCRAPHRVTNRIDSEHDFYQKREHWVLEERFKKIVKWIQREGFVWYLTFSAGWQEKSSRLTRNAYLTVIPDVHNT